MVGIREGVNNVQVPIKTSRLGVGKHEMHVSIIYKDENNQQHELTETFNLTVKDTNIFNKILIWIIECF